MVSVEVDIMLSTARIGWLLGGAGRLFRLEQRADGRVQVECLARADIRSELTCEAGRALRQGNLEVELLGNGRLMVSEKTAPAWLPPPVVADDEDDAALEPLTKDVEPEDEEATDPQIEPPDFEGMSVWSPAYDSETAREQRASRYAAFGVSL